ncbi:RNA polymerase subunit sigma-24 [Arachidicoccus ginsenosidimutans]|uniref:RNA polymerase sigma factor n=1 Tax=Arachidicoccus sp. BS20 TaxID=1850526 RepID=UPI0007F1310F|nr:sigma-70 family RNA polymerase sigma factor [Arachidicoccus sp. BS20]ANI90571.1 RNA polymerase subunit sigma-24 [Arachidicoccus sp. BS20]
MNRHQKYDDEVLVNKFYQTQDNYWLGILLERYTLLLLGVCMKYLKDENEARDAVQQVFYKVLNEFHHSKVTAFRGWIYAVAKNYCLMKLRSEKRLILEEWKEELTELIEDELPQDALDKERRYQYIEQAMKQLNDEQKTCISLFYLHKKTYSEITEITGFSDTQVKSHIQNGKRNLKISIEKMRQNDDE